MISEMKYDVVVSKCIAKTLEDILSSIEYDKLFVLSDITTHEFCLPLLKKNQYLADAKYIVIAPTDTYKNLDTLSYVWSELCDNGGSRHSLVLNVGGGMVTDLGGFAASTFKRGIDYINVPTTLLSMVDASVGGKTGINFNGLKNEIGAFKKPKIVILDTIFLKTLDSENILSGYAEMLKHGLISTIENLDDILSFDFNDINYSKLTDMVAQSVAIKEFVVEEDPYENGIRKALNLGHTVGHAFESWALKRKPCLHGFAVAWGIICELYLSWVRFSFDKFLLDRIVNFVLKKYGKLSITECDLDELYEYMTHDKKNSNGLINFTLLGGVGDIRINQVATKDEIFEMLGYYIRLNNVKIQTNR